MRHTDGLCQCRHKTIALLGQGSGRPPLRRRNRRHDEQTAISERLTPRRWQPQALNITRWTEHYGLCPAQKHVQALLFHWRMKATDNRHLGLAQRQGQIIGAQNNVTRAAGGAEQAEQRRLENVEIADGPQLRNRGDERARSATRPGNQGS